MSRISLSDTPQHTSMTVPWYLPLCPNPAVTCTCVLLKAMLKAAHLYCIHAKQAAPALCPALVCRQTTNAAVGGPCGCGACGGEQHRCKHHVDGTA